MDEAYGTVSETSKTQRRFEVAKIKKLIYQVVRNVFNNSASNNAKIELESTRSIEAPAPTEVFIASVLVNLVVIRRKTEQRKRFRKNEMKRLEFVLK